MAMQIAELHYTSIPNYRPDSISRRVEELVQSGIEPVSVGNESDTLLFSHTKHVVQYKDSSVPGQTAILTTDQTPDVEPYLDRIQQSWSCENAEDLIANSKCTRLITEMMCNGLPPAERITIFHAVLQAMVEISKPHAIVFNHSCQIVDAPHYLESCERDPIQRLGSLNVRFFNISNSSTGDMIMDSRGLEEIGLHDLQCHFRDLDPNDVSQIIFNTALYLFENGPVIESGQTVSGVESDSRWLCQFEESLLEPKRELLDLNPGAPFAAGTRQD